MHKQQFTSKQHVHDARISTGTIGNPVRRAYASPTLRDYGRITDLTAGGSGRSSERNRDFSCNTSPNKMRC